MERPLKEKLWRVSAKTKVAFHRIGKVVGPVVAALSEHGGAGYLDQVNKANRKHRAKLRRGEISAHEINL